MRCGGSGVQPPKWPPLACLLARRGVEKAEEVGHVGEMQTSHTPPEPPWLPPPDPPACLVRAYSSSPSQKGGTLIAEDVLNHVMHQQRLTQGDAYRPAECLHCHHSTLHVHDYRERRLVHDPDHPVITVVRYLCVYCGATWQILPAFVPRHLWHAWDVVESATFPELAQSVRSNALDRSPIAERTVQRWRARLASTARLLVVLFATMGIVMFDTLVASLGLDATRSALVLGYARTVDSPSGRRLADLAAHVHRMMPGLRLV